MEPEGSLPFSQRPDTCVYPGADESNPRTHYFFKIRFNFVLQPTPRLPSAYLPFRLPTKILCAFLISTNFG